MSELVHSCLWTFLTYKGQKKKSIIFQSQLAIIISNAAYMKADIAFPLAGVVAVLALIRLQLGVLVEMFS